MPFALQFANRREPLALSDHVDTGGLTPVPFALQFALSLIVVSCPCTIGLAVPTVNIVATSIAVRFGLLLKSGTVLEILPRLQHVVFDKTGTLTLGALSVAKVVVVAPTVVPLSARLGMRLPTACTPEDSVIAVAAAVAEGSTHPLALSIVAYAQSRSLSTHIDGAQSRTTVPAKGVQATLCGVELLLGSSAFLRGEGVTGMDRLIAEMVPGDQSVVFIAADGALCAVIGLRDTVRPEAAAVVEQLTAMGLLVWVASGDRTESVTAVAASLGIPHERARGELLPADKAALIAALQSDGSCVAMIGDGVNDAPGLVAADVGIAMGAGTAVAMDCADVVVKATDLSVLITLIQLAIAARMRILSNFAWAAVYNVVAMPLAAGVLFPLTGQVTIPTAFAGLSELFSSVPVVLGSLLLYRFKATRMSEVQPEK